MIHERHVLYTDSLPTKEYGAMDKFDLVVVVVVVGRYVYFSVRTVLNSTGCC